MAASPCPGCMSFGPAPKKNHRADAGCACIVDLNEVTFIDKSGERLLRILARARVQFITDGIYTKYVLDRVTSQDRAVPPPNLRRNARTQPSST